MDDDKQKTDADNNGKNPFVDDHVVGSADQVDDYDWNPYSDPESNPFPDPFPIPDPPDNKRSDLPAYYEPLSQLILMNKIVIANPVARDPVNVESATLIGYHKDNQVVIRSLLNLVNNPLVKAHAGIYNNLACARAWSGEYSDARAALQQALTRVRRTITTVSIRLKV